MDDEEHFLSRWSRRKLDAKREAPAALPDAAPPAAAPSAPAAQAPGPAAPHAAGTGYAEFFDPEVDEELRLAALKGLFSDPQFNVMDGLDTYIDDYTLADPIPAAMLRRLNQAKGLLLFDDEKATGAGEAGAAPAAPADAAAPAGAPAAAASDEAAAQKAGIATAPNSNGSANG